MNSTMVNVNCTQMYVHTRSRVAALYELNFDIAARSNTLRLKAIIIKLSVLDRGKQYVSYASSSTLHSRQSVVWFGTSKASIQGLQAC